ncbi:MAG: DUF998 domain-containing protein [Marmoricola sp.]
MRRSVLVSATLAPVALIGGWTVAASRQPSSYDSTRDTISALAAHGAADRWVMTAGLAVLGGCHIVTALGLQEAKPLGRLLLGLGGVSAGLVAVFAQPSAVHFPVATTSFVALAVWPAAAGLPNKTSGWLATGGLTASLAWLMLELNDGALLGLSERVVAGAEALWPLAAVLATRAAVRRTRPAA